MSINEQIEVLGSERERWTMWTHLMTASDLIEALKTASPAHLKEIRSLLGIVAPEHPTLAEITGDPDAGKGFRPKGAREG